MTRKQFTLVEMLTVVAIIGVLAALIFPVVSNARQKGRITQAKSDIASLKNAMIRLESDYGKMLKMSASKHQIGGQDVAEASDVATIKDDAYTALIGELIKGKGVTFSVNKRQRQYLDAKSGYDPAKDYNHADNGPFMWLDPWGQPYKVYIKVTQDNEMELPNTKIGSDPKTIAANVAVYSFGPNGDDDYGCNVSEDQCFADTTSTKHKDHDDLASWTM